MVRKIVTPDTFVAKRETHIGAVDFSWDGDFENAFKSQLEAARKLCGEACRLLISDGVSMGCIILTCPDQNYTTEAEAAADETHCAQPHTVAANGVGQFIDYIKAEEDQAYEAQEAWDRQNGLSELVD